MSETVRATYSVSPLPWGERSTREARRVRGTSFIVSAAPPHPNPLPQGERELTERMARAP